MYRNQGTLGLLLLLTLGPLACEENTRAGEASASAVASVLPPPAPAPPPPATPEAAPTAKRPKKTLEDCDSSKDVSFPNAEFEAAVRLKLQKPDGAIKRADLSRLTSLNLSQVSLDELDICLFWHMTALKELFLGKGQVEDLGPIQRATKLESLRASLNPISDLTPLAKMTKMDRLDLGHSKVTDLTPLAGLTQMTELALDSTPVEDVTPLAKLIKMERLSLQKTKVKDVAALKDMKELKFIYVAETPVADDPLAFAPLRRNGAKVMLY